MKIKSYKEFIYKQQQAYKLYPCNVINNRALLDRNQIIIDLVVNSKLAKDCRILDVGIGPGYVAGELSKLGYKHVEGIDIVDHRDPKSHSKKLELHILDLIDSSKKDISKSFKNKYDLIIFGDVLEHFTQPYLVLYKLESLMKEGTMVIVSVPNAAFFLNFFLLTLLPSKMFLSTAFGPWGHYFSFTFYELDKMLKIVGLKKIRLFGTPIDDHVYRGFGFGGFLFKLMRFLLWPLSLIWPQAFSDHIFGVYQKTGGVIDFNNIYKSFTT